MFDSTNENSQVHFLVRLRTQSEQEVSCEPLVQTTRLKFLQPLIQPRDEALPPYGQVTRATLQSNERAHR